MVSGPLGESVVAGAAALPGRASAQGLHFGIDVGAPLGALGYTILGAATLSLLIVDLGESASASGRQHRIGDYEVAMGAVDLLAGVASWIVLAGAGPQQQDLALGGALGCTVAGALLLVLGISAYTLPRAPPVRVGAVVTPELALASIGITL